MFVSADGNFVLGYTPGGYDVVFGVKALASNLRTVFIQVFITFRSRRLSRLGAGCGDIDSFYGSLIVNSAAEIVHERYVTSFCPAIDFETDNQTTFNSNGTVTDSYGYQYAFGDGGTGVRCGWQRAACFRCGRESSPVFRRPSRVFTSTRSACKVQPATCPLRRVLCPENGLF